MGQVTSPVSQPVVELCQVSKSFPGAAGTKAVEVLRDVNLRLCPGESVAITGPSGSGKSTLLNLIAGLERPSGGRILIRGRDLAGLSDDELSLIRNREIGFVFQMHHLLPQCNVLENVLIPTLASRSGRDGSVSRARQLLERVGLADRMQHTPGTLSGGECQRVAVVRALINSPAVILADEPTGSLDHASAEQLASLLLELNAEEKTTLVVVTHSPALAGKMGRSCVLRDGSVSADMATRAIS